MERLQQRLTQTKSALEKLSEILSFPKTEVHRDAAIQRFEFTTETTWKLAQLFLKTEHGIEASSPKTTMRNCFETGILSEDETSIAIKLIDDRNLATHTYNEDLAETIYSKLGQYLDLLNKIYQHISNI
jgi:nucleotidyltransferase substrate binding protein (TIGR01987 family)